MELVADLQGLRKLYVLLQDANQIHLDQRARLVLKNLLDGATEKALENNSKMITKATEEFRDYCSKCSSSGRKKHVHVPGKDGAFSREVANAIRRIDSGILNLQCFSQSLCKISNYYHSVIRSNDELPKPKQLPTTKNVEKSSSISRPLMNPTLLDQPYHHDHVHPLETASLSTSTTYETTTSITDDSDHSDSESDSESEATTSFPTTTRTSFGYVGNKSSSSDSDSDSSNIASSKGRLRRFRNKLGLILHHHHHHHHYHHHQQQHQPHPHRHYNKSAWHRLHNIFHLHKNKSERRKYPTNNHQATNHYDFPTPIVKGLRRQQKQVVVRHSKKRKQLKGGLNKLVWLQMLRRHGGLKLGKKPLLRLKHI